MGSILLLTLRMEMKEMAAHSVEFLCSWVTTQLKSSELGIWEGDGFDCEDKNLDNKRQLHRLDADKRHEQL